MEYISFPGLGIEPFHIDSTAFTVFGRPIAWYGIIICVGIILAVAYGMFRAKTEKIKTDDITDLAFFLVIFGIIGARLYYVIFEFDRYLVTGKGFLGNLWGTVKNAVGIWNGGIAIYGALIAGFITILVFCKVKKIPLLKVTDLAAPAVMIGQIIGRWGNFVNIEAYGSETSLPWRMGILESYYDDPSLGIWSSEQYVHPTFLYESLWNLLGFAIANLIYRKKKYDGQIFFFYMGWYGFGRMLIEGLRTDSLYIGPFRVSQLVGFVTFVLGVALSIASAKLARSTETVAEQGSEIIEESMEEIQDSTEEIEETESEEEENGENN